jgi:hypothetical protein
MGYTATNKIASQCPVCGFPAVTRSLEALGAIQWAHVGHTGCRKDQWLAMNDRPMTGKAANQ